MSALARHDIRMPALPVWLNVVRPVGTLGFAGIEVAADYTTPKRAHSAYVGIDLANPEEGSWGKAPARLHDSDRFTAALASLARLFELAAADPDAPLASLVERAAGRS